jgi:hypothetical protein
MDESSGSVTGPVLGWARLIRHPCRLEISPQAGRR